MDDNLKIVGPEKVAFSIELAGIGSRFLALAIDLLVLTLGLGLLLISYLFITPLVSWATPAALGWFTLVFSLGGFTLFWGYFIFFEGIFGGQTIGKRVAGIKVVDTAGHPPGLGASVIRNLLRLADWLPGFYAVGVLAILASKENRRLGDMAAGTRVIKDRRTRLALEVPETPSAAVLTSLRLAAHRLEPADFELLTGFLSRRDDLDGPSRAALAARIAEGLSKKLAIEISGSDNESFLQDLAGAYHATASHE